MWIRLAQSASEFHRFVDGASDLLRQSGRFKDRRKALFRPRLQGHIVLASQRPFLLECGARLDRGGLERCARSRWNGAGP